MTGTGTNTMKLDKTNLTNDVLTVTSSMTFGGTLNLPVLSGTLAPNDSFKLFNGACSGTFAALNPPTPGANLAWNTNNLAATGVLSVVSTGPTTNANILSVTIAGTDIILHGTNNNGGQNFRYEVLASTNITLPLSNWTSLATNTFNVDGTFDYTNAINPVNPQRFYDVRAVP
jgi:hypothetical protein